MHRETKIVPLTSQFTVIFVRPLSAVLLALVLLVNYGLRGGRRATQI